MLVFNVVVLMTSIRCASGGQPSTVCSMAWYVG